MKKIVVVLGFLLLINSCVFVGFSKGPFYQNLGNFKTYKKNENVILDLDDQIHVELPKHACGYYGVIAMIVPVLPYWKNAECKNLFLGVSQVSKVYIIHNDKIYHHSRFNPKSYYEYTFPIPVKSLSDGAILIIEKKNKSSGEIEKFEIPFRYQHTFSFELWGT